MARGAADLLGEQCRNQQQWAHAQHDVQHAADVQQVREAMSAAAGTALGCRGKHCAVARLNRFMRRATQHIGALSVVRQAYNCQAYNWAGTILAMDGANAQGF